MPSGRPARSARAAAVLAFLLAAVALLAVSRPAAAADSGWREVHLGGVDVRVTVDPDGAAHVVHRIVYKVLAGTFRTAEISGFDEDARFEEQGTVTADDGRTFSLFVVRDEQGVVHATVDDVKGLRRGQYTFELRYALGLAGRRLTRSGAFYRLRFATPPMSEGTDGMRVVFDLPAAPTEPRAASDDGDDPAAVGMLATLRRTTERDELELLRPHVARGESAAWVARIDPKALPALKDPALRPPSPAVTPLAPSRPWLPWLGAALAGVILAALALAKQRGFAARCARAGAEARGPLRLPAALRVAVASVSLALGVHAQTGGSLLSGAALVALALAALALRATTPPRAARGPGEWLALRPEEVFARTREPGDGLDATTRTGRLVLVGVIAALVALGVASRHLAAAAPFLVAIDALVLVPIFFTGTSLHVLPRARRAAAPLRRVHQALHARDDLRVTPWARFPQGADEADEVRVLTLPRAAMAGVVGVEVGVGWRREGATYAPAFELLVRVQDGSFAAAKMAAYVGPSARPLPGRKPEEKVYRLEPELPGARSACARVVALAELLHDRRLALPAPAYAGEDRRAPPNARRARIAA